MEANEKNRPIYKLTLKDGIEYKSPEEVSSLVLKILREAVNNNLKRQNVRETCVITVPSNFNDLQRSLTLEACKEANL